MEVAETPEQRAFAAYATFVHYQRVVRDLLGDPNVADEAKLVIQAAAQVAKPAADLLLDAGLTVLHTRDELDALKKDPNRSDDDIIRISQTLTVVLVNLDQFYWDAKPKIAAMRGAISSILEERSLSDPPLQIPMSLAQLGGRFDARS